MFFGFVALAEAGNSDALEIGQQANDTPGVEAFSVSRCQLEKTEVRAAAPDLALYVGEGVPQWRRGEFRYINLDSVRPPNLVGEISDTTLALDLDEKKKIYAALGISEYWVVNVQGKQAFFFQLQQDGTYRECESSQILPGLSIPLLEQTLERLDTEPNTAAALWLFEQIQSISLGQQGEDMAN